MAELKRYGGFLDSPKSQPEQAIEELSLWNRGLIPPPNQLPGILYDPPAETAVIETALEISVPLDVMEFVEPISIENAVHKLPNIFSDVWPTEKTFSISYRQKIIQWFNKWTQTAKLQTVC